MVFSGKGYHETAWGRDAIGRGDVFLLRPGTWHTYEDCKRMRGGVCCFGTELLQHELAWLLADPRIRGMCWGDVESAHSKGTVHTKLDTHALLRCRDVMERMFAIDATAASYSHRPDMIALLALLLAELGRSVDANTKAAPGNTKRQHLLVLKAIRLMEESPADRWTLQDLAGRLRMSASYLARLFKAHAGISPTAYLTRHRAELAATMLADTDIPIGDIALRSGWEDPTYFSRRFKSHFGVSASDYRKRVRAIGDEL